MNTLYKDIIAAQLAMDAEVVLIDNKLYYHIYLNQNNQYEYDVYEDLTTGEIITGGQSHTDLTIIAIEIAIQQTNKKG
jgi:CO/xanthine dehydrogenase FAD-binding subunit